MSVVASWFLVPEVAVWANVISIEKTKTKDIVLTHYSLLQKHCPFSCQDHSFQILIFGLHIFKNENNCSAQGLF